MVRTLCQRTQHRATDLEADDVDGAFPGTEPRDLHDQRKGTLRSCQPIDRCHAAGVHQLAQAKAVDLASRARRAHLAFQVSIRCAIANRYAFFTESLTRAY